jgi:prepilin-type N-terminal cleavage/methylation domain-containing protein
MRRRGFTLIELLVVIAIIGILMSLTMVAVSKVRSSAKRTAATTEIAQIGNAVATFKAKFNGAYLPASITVEANYTDAGSDSNSLAYLKTIFPGMDPANTGAPAGTNDVLDSSQTLVFFLTGGKYTGYQGFSTNRSRPFQAPTGTAGEQRVGPFLDVAEAKIKDAVTGVVDDRYRDPWGTPYQYYVHVPAMGVNTYAGGGVPNGGFHPYHQNGKYLNAKSFQIVSAGENKAFGACPAVPASPAPPGAGWTPGTAPWAEGAAGGDDVSNFNSGPLVQQSQ